MLNAANERAVELFLARRDRVSRDLRAGQRGHGGLPGSRRADARMRSSRPTAGRARRSGRRHDVIVSVLYSLLPILGIGFVIFFHELGHFMAARAMGVRVEAFSIGFGPRLFGFRRGSTDWKICLIPLGGFVKMAGETPNAPRTGRLGRVRVEVRRRPVADHLGRRDHERDLRADRASDRVHDRRAVRDAGRSDRSTSAGPAWRAGLRAGDRIISVDGRRTLGYEDVVTAVAIGGDVVTIVAERERQAVSGPARRSRRNGTSAAGFPMIGVEPSCASHRHQGRRTSIPTPPRTTRTRTSPRTGRARGCRPATGDPGRGRRAGRRPPGGLRPGGPGTRTRCGSSARGARSTSSCRPSCRARPRTRPSCSGSAPSRLTVKEIVRRFAGGRRRVARGRPDPEGRRPGRAPASVSSCARSRRPLADSTVTVDRAGQTESLAA